MIPEMHLVGSNRFTLVEEFLGKDALQRCYILGITMILLVGTIKSA